MSFSRRGIVAAGLAIAVVGGIGVSSHLSAGAATITTPDTTADETTTADTTTADTTTTADATTADATTADATAAEPAPPTPPPGLPGGRTGSRRTASLGDSALSSQTRTAPVRPTPRWAPKGAPPQVPARVKSTNTITQAAPAPPVTESLAATALSATSTVNYYYSQASQYADNGGAYAYVTVAKPTLATADLHTLAEIAVQSTDRQQIVEVGWSVDRAVFGDNEPHLFVYRWTDHVESCYNGCGFVQYSSLIRPGATVPVGTTKALDIQFFGDGWWIGYDTEWIGYYPTSLWGGRFTRSGLVQWFGEVAAGPAPPCTDMGNALPATDERAATFTGMGFYGGATPNILSGASQYYSVRQPLVEVPGGSPQPARNAIRFGGPGAC